MKPLRIVVAAEYSRPWPGGISEHVHYEIDFLSRAGHEVTLVGGPGSAAHAPSGVFEVVELPHALHFRSNGAASRMALGLGLLRLRARLSRDRVDVLHVHAPLDPLLPLLTVLCAKAPVVGTFHASHSRHALWSLLYGRSSLGAIAARKLTRAIAVSAEAARSIRQYQPSLPLTQIPNGVDCARFTLPRKPSAGGPLRLLFVGRPDPRKGLPVLLAAMERLIASGRDVSLCVVGPSVPPASMSAGARSRTTFRGELTPDAVARAYADADVLVAPSLSGESQGIVLLEGAAAGLCVVASDIPGYREVLSHDRTGLLTPPGDPRAIEHAIDRLLREPTLGSTLAGAATDLAVSYDWGRIGPRIEACLVDAAMAGVASREQPIAAAP